MCGQVGRNDRHDDHREAMYRFTVRAIDDLHARIVPFFEEHPLFTAKSVDFDKFAVVVRMMRHCHHLRVDGLAEIAAIAQTMNRRKPSRYLESSEAIRQPSRIDDRDEDMVQPS
jgi:LAGLIDADG endonuclease